MTIEALKARKADVENQLKQARADAIAMEGAILVLTQLIAEEEAGTANGIVNPEEPAV